MILSLLSINCRRKTKVTTTHSQDTCIAVVKMLHLHDHEIKMNKRIINPSLDLVSEDENQQDKVQFPAVAISQLSESTAAVLIMTK